jgi:hypothetical protein
MNSQHINILLGKMGRQMDAQQGGSTKQMGLLIG